MGIRVRFILTGGERNDITQIEGLLDGLKAGHVLSDITSRRGIATKRDGGGGENQPSLPSVRRVALLLALFQKVGYSERDRDIAPHALALLKGMLSQLARWIDGKDRPYTQRRALAFHSSEVARGIFT